jgi:hypothetical protein
MSITYPLDFPDVLTIENFEIGLRTSSAKTVSPFSLAEQVFDFGGQVWELKGAMPPMTRENAAVYSSFVMSLRGQVGTFLMPIPDSKNPLGSWGGTPVVSGGGQTGDELVLSGLPASQTGVAKAGDYISLGSGNNTRLHRVVEDADSDGSGNMTVTIVPRLRVSPNDLDAVTYQNAKGVFRMVERMNSYGGSPSSLYDMKIACREAL